MGCESIVFPGHVSKEDMSDLVVKLIEYILFMRGQCPFARPEEGTKYVNDLQKRGETDRKVPFEIYTDSTCAVAGSSIFVEHQEKLQMTPKSHQLKKAEQRLVQSVQNFEDYFQKLRVLLCSHEICEVVLNFGQNFRLPKELYHIKLSGKCASSNCGEKRLSSGYSKRYLFRTLLKNNRLFDDLPSEILCPISVMLLATPDMAIAEYMEQKPFYSVPTRKKYSEIELTYECQHSCYDLKTSLENSDMVIDAESANKLSLDEEALSSSKSDLWVQLKPMLKGFKI